MRTTLLSLLLLTFGGWAMMAQSSSNTTPAEEYPFWGDPTFAPAGKAKARPEFISYTTRELAKAGDRTAAPHYLPLTQWRVLRTTTAQGGESNFYHPLFSVEGWETLSLPAAPTMGSAGAPPLEGLAPPELPTENPMLQLRTTIEVPYLWLDRDVFIHVEGMGGAYMLFVNQHPVGYSNDGQTPAEYHLSPYLTDGANTISIEHYAISVGQWLEGERPRLALAPAGPIYVYSQPKLSVRDFMVTTHIDPETRNGWAEITAVISNSYRSTEKVSFGYDIYLPNGGKLLTYNLKETEIAGESCDTLRFHEWIYQKYQFPWTPQTPALYDLMLYMRRDGRITEYIPWRFGFMPSEWQDGVFYVDGKPQTLTTAAYDAASSESETRAELQVLKRQGVNTLSPSYPQPAWFYELTDEMGFYVIDQANIRPTYRTGELQVGGTIVNDPRYLPQFIDRIEQMQGRSKSYTSVIATSLAGDAGNGYNLYKSYQHLKAIDTLRPVTYRDVQGEWNSDLELPINFSQ